MARIGTEKWASVYMFDWKEKKRVPNRFLSVPFRKRTIGTYGPFFGTEREKLERAKYRLHVKVDPRRSTFYPSRSIFFVHVNGPFVFYIQAIISHPHFLTGSYHLLSDVFQNKIKIESCQNRDTAFVISHTKQ